MELDNKYDENEKAVTPEQDGDDKTNDKETKVIKYKEFPFTLRLQVPEGFEFNLSEINVTQHCGEVVLKIVPGTTPDTTIPPPNN